MKINILAFGQIEEIIGSNQITLTEISDTEVLKNKLSEKFPGIDYIPYTISINKTIIQTKMALKDGDEVALLPPFSGG
jgi:molybdopterin converting factor small subunit